MVVRYPGPKPALADEEAFEQLLEMFVAAVGEVPGLGFLVELLTGIEDGNENDLASFINDIRNGIFPAEMLSSGLGVVAAALMGGLLTGYAGTPTPPTPMALEAVGANLQTRITNLENGGQQWLLANSDTLDLSGFTEVKVWLWPASYQANEAFNPGGSNDSTDMSFRAFTVAQLEAFGVDVTAVDVSVAAGFVGSSPPAGSLKSKFANGTSGWVMESDDQITDENGFTREVPAGSGAARATGFLTAPGSWTTNAYGRIVDNRISGGTSRNASNGTAGKSTRNSVAGTGGIANQTTDGPNGGDASNSDFTYRIISGGASGGNAAGGGVDGSTPKNGGNGGNGAWPGGYPGLPGAGGQYIPIVGAGVAGYTGFIGAPANGGAIVEAS